ncbi:MerR family transcriptional regulator [Aneurinibacillus migulanus]|uniref:MerR HTH family regulatory protein n=2 Tax=Aneurinibacillus migulanus TaxID=47500 RepID=A0A0D1YG21_ANEMI|nr:MerR family transcriptional regulator [Aneurinibacillus migulanus]KIV57862.1 MerR family transcriptional regulator [Aneurinibacillus migulanus]KON97381.1 MerR family transcriptional regulator [Aneurinibacillus migulanus]MED0893935.1 MerR family transcriptional regulator [Aneurinibacillus migulanus]MED1616700.1 MerR family transcriptional regulator [Aneurinibacillus migulanus]SDI99799.1 MerR HTH family regulatory protein [Aneurinibacillus migulanus]
MNMYTAKQLTTLLQEEGADINLRTVRYYTQIGILPPLELVGNKRVYTDKHIHYVRAILTLARTGESLASIQEKLQDLPLDAIEKIGAQRALYQPGHVLENETHKIGEDVFITVSPRISAEVKQKMLDSVSRILKEGEQ